MSEEMEAKQLEQFAQAAEEVAQLRREIRERLLQENPFIRIEELDRLTEEHLLALGADN